jgi:hypothetical protein
LCPSLTTARYRRIDGNAWCGALSGKMFIWDVRDLRCRMVHELGTVPVWSVVEHRGTVWAAVGATIVRFNAQTFAKIDELKGHTKPITCMLVLGDEVRHDCPTDPMRWL